jgi:hypothetical protein
MKSIFQKVMIASFLVVSYVILSSFNNTKEKDHKHPEQSTACKYGQCMATAASTGNRCLHCVSNSGDSYCWQHR